MLSLFFSIIIPSFNSADTIVACLESIHQQSFQNKEIIVIDGGSSDDTIDILKSYANHSSTIKWISEKDNGIYDAMNKGINAAKGKWILFLGSDDKLNNSDVLASVADKISFRQNNVIYGNVKLIGDSSWAKHGDVYDGEFNLEKLLQKNICHQAVFYNLEFIKKSVGFYNTDYFICSDWDFNLRCWAQTLFLYVDIIIADFHGGGATTISSEDLAFSKDFGSNLIKYFGLPKLKRLVPKSKLLRLGIINANPLGIKKWLINKLRHNTFLVYFTCIALLKLLCSAP